MSLKATQAVWMHTSAKNGALLVMLCLADHADKDMEARPGVARIAELCRIADTKHVRKLIAQLEADGEITVRRDPGKPSVYLITPGSGTPSLYTPNVGGRRREGSRGSNTQGSKTQYGVKHPGVSVPEVGGIFPPSRGSQTPLNRMNRIEPASAAPPPAPASAGENRSAAAVAALVSAGISRSKAEALGTAHTEAEVRMALRIWADDTRSDRARLGLVASILGDGTARARLDDWVSRRLNTVRRTNPERFAGLTAEYEQQTGEAPPAPDQDCRAFYDWAYMAMSKARASA